MFRKFAKGPEQNLSIICKDSIYNSYIENPSKGDPSDSKENAHRFSKFGCCQPTLPTNTPSQCFWSLAHFLRIGIKNNSSYIAQNILSKEVKQVLQKRGGGTELAMELLKKTKPLAKLYCRYFHNIRCEFCLNGVRMDRIQIR